MSRTPSLLLAALLGSLGGCASQTSGDVNVTVLTRSDHCGLDQGWRQIRQAEDLPQALRRIEPSEATTTLLISMGQRPTGGFDIGLPEQASRDDAGVHLDVSLDAPPADAMVTQALTSPCVLLQLDVPPDTPVHLHFSGTAAEPPPRQ